MALPSKLFAVEGIQYLRRDTLEALPSSRYYTDFRDPRDTSKHHLGRRRREFIGTNFKVAKATLLRMLYEAQVQGATPPKVEPEAGQHLLAEAQQGCMADLVAGGLEKSTQERYARSDRAALTRFGALFLNEITKKGVKTWFVDRAREFSPTGANRDLGRLAQVLDWAIEAGWLLSANPARKIKHFAEVEKSEPFTDEEWARLFEAALTEPELLDTIVFAGETGMRQGEQLNLSWTENIRAGTIWLRSRESRRRAKNQTKTKKGRAIPINPTVAAILERQRQRHPAGDLVFPNTKGRVWHRGNFRKWRWRPLFERAGLYEDETRSTWHKFRHDFCSRLRQGGVDLVDIADLAGHDNLAVTRRYAHHFAGHLEAKMARSVRPQIGLMPPSNATQEGEVLAG